MKLSYNSMNNITCYLDDKRCSVARTDGSIVIIIVSGSVFSTLH